MKPLILEPKFIDRAGRTVFDVHEDDPDCRVYRCGQFLGQLRFDPTDPEKDIEFERIEQLAIPLKGGSVQGDGSG